MPRIVNEFIVAKSQESENKDIASELRSGIIKGMKKRNLEEIMYDGKSHTKYKGIKLLETKSIVYDVDKVGAILKAIDKELYDEVISHVKVINVERLNDLFELGEITLEALNGCYEIKIGEQLRVIK